MTGGCDKLRASYGFDLHLLHVGHHRMTPLEAAQLGKSLEPYGPSWLGDTTPAENQLMICMNLCAS